jgi:hypothetical protein
LYYFNHFLPFLLHFINSVFILFRRVKKNKYNNNYLEKGLGLAERANTIGQTIAKRSKNPLKINKIE